MLQLASTFLLGRSESAPSGSLAVEYLVQASSAAPSGKSLCGYSLFFEVVELVLDAVVHGLERGRPLLADPLNSNQAVLTRRAPWLRSGSVAGVAQW